MPIDFKPREDMSAAPAQATSTIDFKPREPEEEEGELKTTFDKQMARMLRVPTPQNVIDRSKGLLQGAQNVGIGYANLLPGVNINKVNWAPQNEETRVGETGAEVGSFFLPGNILKAIKSIPYIGNALKATVKGLEHRPILNALAKVGGGATSGAISSAALGKKEDQAENALFGAGIGGGANALTQLATANNPVINALARAGLGGAIGGGIGALEGEPVKGAATGAGIGLGFPQLAKMAGLSKAKPGRETLEHLESEEVMPVVEAGLRLKTPITPGETGNNSYIGGIEGRYGRSGEAAAEKAKIEKGRIIEQKDAINNLLNKIFPTSATSEHPEVTGRIKNLYSKVYENNLTGNEFVSLLQSDPIVMQAYNKVSKDPAYQRSLKGIEPYNYAYLDEMNRAISDMEGKALVQNEKRKARQYSQARKSLQDIMDEKVPEYKIARQEAQREIIRTQMEEKLGNKQITGANFYKAFLENDNNFDRLVKQLKNVPDAQNMLRDMKLSWKELANPEKAKNRAFRSETGLGERRNPITQIVDLWNDLMGQKSNIEALKFIHGGEWHKELDAIQHMKDVKKRNASAANLFSKLTAGAIISDQSHGSDKYGNFLPSSTEP